MSRGRWIGQGFAISLIAIVFFMLGSVGWGAIVLLVAAAHVGIGVWIGP